MSERALPERARPERARPERARPERARASPNREIVLTGAGGSAESVVEVLEGSFAVVAGPVRRVRRSWLDSFDWRLHRAGLVFEQRCAGTAKDLVLCTTAGQTVAVAPGVLKPPVLIDALGEPGLVDVADQLGHLLGVRALLDVARASSSVRELRLLNEDEKTIARITVEVSTDGSASGGSTNGSTDGSTNGGPRSAALTRITVTALRGYENQAARAHRLIAGLPGAVAEAPAPLDAALAAQGRWTGDYTGKIDVPLGRSASPTASVAVVLLSILDVLEANIDGVIRDVDTEFLHDLRVAVRRIRSALKLLGDVLPPGVAARMAPEFKWLGDITTPVRDLDVYLLDIVGPGAGEAKSDAALAPFRRLLEASRRVERRRLLAGLRSARFTAMRAQWRATFGEIAGSQEVIGPVRTVGELAALRIGRAHKRLLKRGSAITVTSPAQDLHDLRKSGKELRTLLDLFASVLDAKANSAVTKELKVLQDCLGHFQDSEVQAHGVVTLAEQVMAAGAPAATLLAMGALTERLDVRRRSARADFAETFARFTGAGSVERMRVLTDVAAP